MKDSKEKTSDSGGILQEFYEEMKILVSVLSVIVLIFYFVFQIVVVSGSSMYPTLHPGDLMLTWQLGYQPKQGDIIVANVMLKNDTRISQESIVKRVIATEGQSVSIDYSSNTVYVDGQALDEFYINFEDQDPMEVRGDVYDITVPEDTVFVMGDNRNHSTDSRFTWEIGAIHEDHVIGKVIWLIYPFDRFGGMEDR